MSAEPPIIRFSPEASGEDGLAVDLNRLVAGRMLVQGNSGAGKSWLIRYMLEQTYGAIPHLVLDPEGEFYTLREDYGYVWAGAGDEADVPLHPDTAKVMARRFVEVGASGVLDLFELELDDRREFIARFADELVHLPRKLWKPLLVVLDEAHQYVPQKGSVVSSQPMINLCALGRKRGFTPCLATHRLSKIDKDAAAVLQNKFIGRTDLDTDVRRASDHLGLDKDGRQRIRHLDPGTFFCYGPAFEHDGITLARSGDVQTTHPEPGEITPSPPPPPDEVTDLLGQLEGMAEEAEEEERTIEALRAKVDRLREKLDEALERVDFLQEQNQDLNEAMLGGEVGDQRLQELRDEITEEVREELEAEYREKVARAAHDAAWGVHYRWQDWADEVREAHEAHRGVMSELEHLLEETADERELPDRPDPPDGDLAEVEAEGRAGSSGSGGAPRTPARPAAGSPDTVDRASSDPMELLRDPDPRHPSLGQPEQRVLNALATLHELGVEAPENDQVAAFAGYKTGGYWRSIRGGLSTDEMLEYPTGGHLRLTRKGRRYAVAAEITSVDQVHQLWMDLCTGPQRKLLRVLIDVYPRAISSEQLAERSGYSQGGYFRAIRGKLSTMGALEYPETGRVQATDLLFPENLS